ncbi:class I SAM-dependent methyltransferase [Marinobacter alexandrii]|uniref:class I SAM-dependent methyltransferase n=1 Tax=Marinobacter alexandrii TaxID=2570351 RepID=UPI00329844BF
MWRELTHRGYLAIDSSYSGPDVPLRFRYHTYEFGQRDIHLRSLRDTQQFQDPTGSAEELGISPANWSLFGVVWDSSQVLANLMADYNVNGLRILELGCGLALSSLLLNLRGADITATDYHPEAEGYLEINTVLNDGDAIPFVRTGWEDADSGLGKFDLIIGSDVLYESEHYTQLANFVEAHSNPSSTTIIVDPGRKQHARFSKVMVSKGFTHSQHPVEDTTYLAKPHGGVVITYTR